MRDRGEALGKHMYLDRIERQRQNAKEFQSVAFNVALAKYSGDMFGYVVGLDVLPSRDESAQDPAIITHS